MSQDEQNNVRFILCGFFCFCAGMSCVMAFCSALTGHAWPVLGNMAVCGATLNAARLVARKDLTP